MPTLIVHAHAEVRSLNAVLTEQRHVREHRKLPSDVAREIERQERADLVILQWPAGGAEGLALPPIRLRRG